MTSIHRHVCVYCGAVAESRDHVPPKAWFAREARTLIRVPACNTCNHGRSAADEEFRIALSLLAGLKTPTLRKLWKKSLKTLRHAPRIQRKFASGVFKDQATGRSGINLPRRMFDDAMTRIVRGLHWYHYRELVPIDAPIEVWHLSRSGFEEARNSLVMDLRSDHVGHDQFAYMHGRPIDKPELSLWLLCFYRNVFFSVVTGYDSEIDEETV